MSNEEKMMCQLVFEKGDIVSVLNSECDGINIACYIVELNGESYTLTSHNGEWIYFHHDIKMGR